MTILIPLETTSRELLYKTYLCHLLALKGFNCYLGNKRNISFLINKFQDYIYLDKGYHVGVSDKIYETIKSKNGIVVNLDEEGAVDYPDNSTLERRYSGSLFDHSAMVFLWGDRQYQLIKEILPEDANVEVTGHPRFELLKPAYYKLYEEEVDRIKQKFGDFILINTNMGFGNNIKGDQFVRENYGPRFKNIEDIIAFDKKKMEIYISLVRNIASRKNQKVILRPHPEEDTACYTEALQGFGNVKVVFEGSAVPWLLAADVMIHPDCTTGIEALFLGKKSISYLPEKYNSELVTSLPLKASYTITGEDTVVEFLEKEEYRTDEYELKGYPFADDYFSITKKSSAIITDTIAGLAKKNNSYQISGVSFKDKCYLYYRSAKFSLQTGKAAKLVKNKLKGFDSKEMKSLHEKITGLNEDLSNVELKRIASGLFRFSRVNNPES